MLDTTRSVFTSVNATPIGIRYVLLADVAGNLREECETYARRRQASLVLDDGAAAVFYEEWLEWHEKVAAASPTAR